MTPFDNLLLLAQSGNFSHMGRSFRPGGNSIHMGQFFLISVVIAVATIVLWVVATYYNSKNSKGYNSPAALFRELCKAHQIDFKSRHLLRQLARWHQLTQPASLFLEPERYDPAALSPALQQQGTLILELRDRIFGTRLDEN